MVSKINSDILQSLYTPHHISDVDLVSVKDHFFTSFVKGGTHQQAIETIHHFFSDKGYKPEVIQEYGHSYFDWFVTVVWENPWAVSVDIWPDIVAYTYPTAVAYGYDCLSIYIQYAIEFVDRPDIINSAHRRVKFFFDSASFYPINIFSPSSSISYSQISQFVEDGDKMDTIKKAEFLSVLERDVRQLYEAKFFLLDGVRFDEKVQSLLFFWRMVFQISNLDKVAIRFFWEQAEVLDRESKLSIPELSEDVKVCLGINLLLQDVGQPVIPVDILLKTLTPVISRIVLDRKKTEYSFDVFNKKDTGQIIQELDAMATERQESRIRDVYYYNEATGKFEWDEALLKELKLVPSDFDMSTVKM
jgi:hypothetical protein